MSAFLRRRLKLTRLSLTIFAPLEGCFVLSSRVGSIIHSSSFFQILLDFFFILVLHRARVNNLSVCNFARTYLLNISCDMAIESVQAAGAPTRRSRAHYIN